MDFLDTFSPVAKLVTVKVLLTLATFSKWHLVQVDVNNAFLSGDLFEDIYMDLPLRYNKSRSLTKSDRKLVYHLHKSIYGLKQASRQWFSKSPQALLQYGFTQSKSDYSLFTKGSDSSFMALLIYVHDIVLTGPSLIVISTLKDYFHTQFKMKLVNLKYFLGFGARSSTSFVLSQRHYTLQLLEDTDFLASKPTLIPIDPHGRLNSTNVDLLLDASQYRRLIRRLLYRNLSRPDITYAVQQLSQFLSHSCVPHLQALHHLLRYLKSNPGQGIFFSSSSSFQLRAFSDTVWASCPDSHKSISLHISGRFLGILEG